MQLLKEYEFKFSSELRFVVLKKLSILSAFKTRGKTLTICPAEKRENVIRWRYISVKRCAVRTGTRSARDTRISKFRYSLCT
jgi:hypothetical protein